ncbi:competence protein ComG, partial [Lysinibacillus agricola]
GYKAYISIVQKQIKTYQINFIVYPTIKNLVTKSYLKKNKTACPNKKKIIITNKKKIQLTKTSTKTGSNK